MIWIFAGINGSFPNGLLPRLKNAAVSVTRIARSCGYKQAFHSDRALFLVERKRLYGYPLAREVVALFFCAFGHEVTRAEFLAIERRDNPWKCGRMLVVNCKKDYYSQKGYCEQLQQAFRDFSHHGALSRIFFSKPR
jgi:hypothetical protein